LAVVGLRAILTRVLRNLENPAERDREADDMLRYLDAILVIGSDSVRDRREGFDDGVAFYGNTGSMLIGGRGWKVGAKGNEVLLDKRAGVARDPHVRNFLDAVRSGTPLSCDIEEGFRSSLLALLGNLSYRVGRPLEFDAATHTVRNDPEANALVNARSSSSPRRS
jgi:hypothetical protein